VVAAGLAATACYSSSPWAGGGDSALHDVEDDVRMSDAGACEVATEPPGADCSIEEPTPTGGWPEVGDGATACPRGEGLAPEHGGSDGTLLLVRGASTVTTHRRMDAIGFGAATGICSHDAVTMQYQAMGPGRYAVAAHDEDELAALPFTATAWKCGLSGTGVLVLRTDTREWPEVTHGSVDVVFPDATRLLVDFSAPWCGGE
jgi:hypothetical protein